MRPTDAQRHPAALPVTDARLQRLYDLIWRRTLASQMAAARIQQVLHSGFRINIKSDRAGCLAVRDPGGSDCMNGLCPHTCHVSS